MTSHKVLALMFELRAENGRTGVLIAWLDQLGQGKHLRHSHPSRTLLEAKAGDRLVFKGQHLLTVVRVKPWRATDCRDETQYDWVTSGAAWERSQ
jgi:hypothetical protein